MFKRWRITLYVIFGLIVLALVSVIYFSVPPSNFPQKKIITITKGMYMSQAADALAQNHIVKSTFLFKVFSVLASGRRSVQAGSYLFDQPQSSLRVAYRLVYGDEGLPKIKVTFFEGMASKDMGDVLKKNVPNFDEKTFLSLAKPLEGQLMPDTYYVNEAVQPAEIVDLLHSTFESRLWPVQNSLSTFGRPVSDVITMASLVEKEATSSADRRIIAGILWKRLKTNMPLQVDPPFYYLLGKNSSQLTLSDLAIDSPYNLYKHTGLPPTPIDNPGISAIVDTLNPVDSKYWFFLSDSKGNMHYSATFIEHNGYKNKYLQ